MVGSNPASNSEGGRSSGMGGVQGEGTSELRLGLMSSFLVEVCAPLFRVAILMFFSPCTVTCPDSILIRSRAQNSSSSVSKVKKCGCPLHHTVDPLHRWGCCIFPLRKLRRLPHITREPLVANLRASLDDGFARKRSRFPNVGVGCP